jgi:hypothetical protein
MGAAGINGKEFPVMPTTTTLATGLAGAIGCHLHGATQRLFFVEFGGRLSVFNFVRGIDAVLLNNVSRTLNGTWLMNLDTGVMGSAGGDVWWEQIDTVRRRMVPRNGARIAYLGVMTAAQFGALSAAQLQGLDYGTDPIVGDDNASNRLVPGAVFAVRTDSGHYAKVRVVTYGYNLTLRITTWRLKPAYQVLGTGYTNPEDVKVTADGATAYITERSGNLLRVALNGVAAPNRASASVVAAGLAAPHQIALREDLNVAYVVEFAPAGHLVRIDLGTGARTNVAFNLENAIGLLVTGDHRWAYVSEQAAGGGRVRRVDLASGRLEPVLGGFTAPFMMAFNNASESAILIAERDPANRIALIDLGVSPVQQRVVAPGVAARPSSVALLNATTLLVCSDTVLSRVELADSVLTGSGPLLLGVGHVPVDRIVGGYADTTVDPAYFFQRKDCPFGGSLPLMFNHERARNAGAAYYKVLVDGAEVGQPFGDYLWSNSTQRFEYTPVLPDAAGFYTVRQAGQLWYNAWLGLMYDSTVLANGLHTVEVRLYNAARAPMPVPAGVIASRALKIDNSWPTVALSTIFHAGAPVGTCEIVTTGPDSFSFEITASDPEGHLSNWTLQALWGDNKSALVASDRYANHASPSKLWPGVVNALVPAGGWAATVPGDSTSKRCAHTFMLTAWDRVINGWNDLHHGQVHKSITIMLP